MSTPIYVVVLVVYNCDRLQDNIGASLDFQEAMDIAKKKALEIDPDAEGFTVITDEDESRALDGTDYGHFWIQKFHNHIPAIETFSTS